MRLAVDRKAVLGRTYTKRQGLADTVEISEPDECLLARGEIAIGIRLAHAPHCRVGEGGGFLRRSLNARGRQLLTGLGCPRLGRRSAPRAD